MKRLNEILNRPFPFWDKAYSKWLFIIALSAFIYLFLIIFQPFRLTDIESLKVKLLLVLGYSLITFIVLGGTIFFLLPLWINNTSDANEITLGKLILLSTTNVFFIGLLNWFYNNYLVVEYAKHTYSFFEFILMTFSVGVLPVIILILWLERLLMKRNMREAEKIMQSLKVQHQQIASTTRGKEQHILLGQVGEKISLLPSEICCIKAEGNYAEIYYYEKEKIRRAFLRTSLLEIQEQLSSMNEKNIILCHRSYIANFEHIINITGNARNYNLHLKGLHFSIPVSRSFPKEQIKIHQLN